MARLPLHRPLSEYPQIRRDLAFVVQEQTSAAAIVSAVQALAEPLLRDILVFDVYRGQGLQSGFKSIALGLIFQEYSRTLTDTEVDQSVSRVQAHLQQELGATVRG
jgi:phenylalanyl-tRNA synthetase beta chain